MSEWERWRHRGVLVAWRRYLAPGEYLAVRRQDDGRWRWEHRGPELATNDAGRPVPRINAEGAAGTSAAAKRAADRHALALAANT